jgi:hypothetical protein
MPLVKHELLTVPEHMTYPYLKWQWIFYKMEHMTVMNKDMTGLLLQQMEHIRGHLWHRYSVTDNQVMVVTLKLSKWWLQLNL